MKSVEENCRQRDYATDSVRSMIIYGGAEEDYIVSSLALEAQTHFGTKCQRWARGNIALAMYCSHTGVGVRPMGEEGSQVRSSITDSP